MKTILLLATLTLLASCTKPPEVAPTPVPETKMIDENKDMPEAPMMKDQESMPDAMMKDDMKEPLMMSGEMMDHSGMDMKEKETMMMKPTWYMDYDETKVSEALVSGQKVALFFHATWCPTCKALEKSINTEISSIPSDALIVNVDYDTSTEISKKLGARNISEVLN